MHTFSLKLIKTKAMYPHSLDFKFILDDSKKSKEIENIFQKLQKQLRHILKTKQNQLQYQLILSGKFNTSKHYRKLFITRSRHFFA